MPTCSKIRRSKPSPKATAENLDIFDFELSAAEMDSIRPLDRPREFQGSHRDPELVRFLLDYDKKFNPANK